MTKKFGLLAMVAILASALFLTACGSEGSNEELAYKPGKTIKPEEARVVAEDFINEFLMMDGMQASVRSDGLAYDLYRLKITFGSEEPIESFISKDGRLFFPQALNIEEFKEEAAELNNAADISNLDLPKSDRPQVELFVMTYCPYGTQMQKGILPALEVLGDSIDFQQKYVDYAMHDKQELDENLLQYCIEKNNPDEFLNYLECFLADGQSASCLDENVTNQSTINSCITETDAEFKITENYNNKVDWRGNYPGFNLHKSEVDLYGVSGSPTLIINGQEVPASRDSASLLQIICSAFNNPPESCNTQLPNTAPSPGFGYNTTGANTDASCG